MDGRGEGPVGDGSGPKPLCNTEWFRPTRIDARTQTRTHARSSRPPHRHPAVAPPGLAGTQRAGWTCLRPLSGSIGMRKSTSGRAAFLPPVPAGRLGERRETDRGEGPKDGAGRGGEWRGKEGK